MTDHRCYYVGTSQIYWTYIASTHAYTVQPVYKDHPWEENNMVFVHGWSFIAFMQKIIKIKGGLKHRFYCICLIFSDSHHVEHSDQTRSNRKHKCPLCSKGFPSRYKLERHIRAHTGEKPFVCNVCGAGFSQNCHLKSHSLTHMSVKFDW